MIGLSVCSGIGAPELASPWIDWRYQSEIEPFPCAVLKERFPNAKNLGDMTNYKEWPDATIDVLCGGTPCQSFSVAGLRKGLDDPRGNLMLTYLAIARRYRPRWLVWENVPGVLSSNGGRDFGTLLWGLGECGYGFAYRVLDAQFVRTCDYTRAVPQRRRRVFVVGHLGDWRRAAAVLFDGESLSGNPPPRREAGKVPAATTGERPTGGSELITSHEAAPCLTARERKGALPEADLSAVVAHTLKGEGFDASEDGTGRGTPIPVAFDCKGTEVQTATDGSHPPLRSMGHNSSHQNAGGHAAVAFDLRGREGGAMPEGPHETANIRASSGGSSRSYVATPWAVRRLTPTECERLQGFPDRWTEIPWRGKPADKCPDGPRYKALGNSWAVNCGQYVFDRIKLVEETAP